MGQIPKSSAWPSTVLLGTTILLAAPLDAAERAASDLLSAVVGVRAEIPASARTAGTLGRERLGSGVVIDANGLIVTIGYLVLEACKVEVATRRGQRVEAKVLAYDHRTGFGLLRARGKLEVTPMRLGDATTLAVDDRVLVSSFGGASATRGAVTVSRRDFTGYWEYLLDDAIFTVPPHPLYGGAALVGPQGTLLGIGSLMVADAIPGEDAVPGNMFVPIDRLSPILANLIVAGRGPEPAEPWIGVYADELEGRIVIMRLAEDGPAERAGVRTGDIVLSVAGTPIDSMGGFYRELWATGRAGNEIDLELLTRDGVRRVPVVSGDRYEWLRLDSTC